MKRRLTYNLSAQKEKITKPTSGNTANRAERWCSTFGWAGNGKAQTIPGRLRGHTPERWLCGIRSCGGPKIVHAACWAHARRKFFQAVELNPQDRTAIGIVAQLDELFEIDAQARKQGLSQEDRQLLRLEKSKPLLEQIKSQIQAARTSRLPKSVLAKACNYTLALWSRLTRFLEHPELELSNNLAENSMRPAALGRRYEQLGIRQSLRTSKPKKFASLLRGSRVNAGEVWRAPGSDTRYGIDLVPPKIGLPSDGG